MAQEPVQNGTPGAPEGTEISGTKSKTRPRQKHAGDVFMFTRYTWVSISLKLINRQVVVTHSDLISYTMVNVFRQKANRTIRQQTLNPAHVSTAG